MPAFNKIDENKMAELIEQKRTGRRISKREKIMQMYMEQLKALKVGEGLEVVLEPGDNRQTVKNRLRRAAERLEYEIEFLRTRGVIRLYRKA